MAILRAADVANYFLAMQASVQAVDRITNLKIQKLCYYAQGLSLARFHKPLFFDDIQHWQHGPVIPSSWREYRSFGSNPIPLPKQPLNVETYSWETRRLLYDVMRTFGHLSAWELRNRTHAEPPWIDTRDGSSVTHQKMRDYFEPLVEDMKAFSQQGRADDTGKELAHKMANAPKFRELTERGLADLAAGRYSSLEDVRRSLGDI